MSTTAAAALEAPRALGAAGDTDAVTFSFADAEAQLYGLVRVARGVGADGTEQSSTLAIAFAGREPLGALARAESEASPAVTATVDAPLEQWTLTARGEVELKLTFAALTPPAELGGRERVAKAGGMEGYEQLCAVRGTLRAGGHDRVVHGLGQRGRSWGNPDWDKIALTRSVGAWLDDGSGIVIAGVRPTGAESHADEALWASAMDPERTRTVEDPRLSTTSDAGGHQIRAGIELWIDKHDDYPYRGSGEIVAGSTLELGALRLDCAFFRWHVEGRSAIGRYDVIRRA
jgi:hypothetical protein